MENKQQILDKLLEAIRVTRAGDDVTKLEYLAESGTVNVYFNGALGRRINVAMDSGMAMIQDVVNHIDIG